jgi:hypothetical protein
VHLLPSIHSSEGAFPMVIPSVKPTRLDIFPGLWSAGYRKLDI